uniref:Uncharacterized protein n=1 Tax=Anguilla anguilla TaxID=7936 RepID=A0A0E9XFP6_ANGAN
MKGRTRPFGPPRPSSHSCKTK